MPVRWGIYYVLLRMVQLKRLGQKVLAFYFSEHCSRMCAKSLDLRA